VEFRGALPCVKHQGYALYVADPYIETFLRHASTDIFGLNSSAFDT